MERMIKVGYIGLGRRGYEVLNFALAHMEDVNIAIICDTEQSRLDRAAELIEKHSGRTPIKTKDYHDILNDPTIEAVFIMTGWIGRPKLAMEFMRAGKYTAIEVGCADTLQECWDLVDTYEETGTPVMMMENCCYGRREMLALNMRDKGMLGELVYCTGAYMHYLNKCELFKDIDTTERKHYRLGKYIHENRESYPTHALGPVCKVLSINRGNKMNRLISVASKARGLKRYAADYLGVDSYYANIDYKQGDIVNTTIVCENGETISLTLDTTLPRAYYSRDFSVRGTKGMIDEARRAVYLEGMEEVENNEKEMFEKYDHPLYEEVRKEEERFGHDGTDWQVCRAFLESVRQGVNTPIDVYDTAAWMSIGPLSMQSIENGGFIEIPDFTRGKWKDREAPINTKYCLDKVVEG